LVLGAAVRPDRVVRCYRRHVARLAKTTQTALDELDRSCSADEIHDWLIPRARIALGDLPGSCFDSVEQVLLALANSESDGQLPAGYGSACVRHFGKRSGQLQRISNRGIGVEYRFALIELTSLANVANHWSDSQRPRTAQASYKEYLRQTSQVVQTTYVERRQWRQVIDFVLESMSSTPVIIRNIAYALAWCGYFSPDGCVTDEQLAVQFFGEDRAEFNRFRQDGLRLLTMLLEFSIRPSTEGMS
jgi:hypothetical protein